MKSQTLWKKGLMILLIVEVFLFTVGILIHEGVHSLTFFFLSGKLGAIHILDTVAFSYNTIAVCIPPQGPVIQDTVPLELIAYGTQFLITGLFALLLIKIYYFSPKELVNMKSGDEE
jgi:hypothetical protein